MGNSNDAGPERTRAICLRLFAMVACAAAFAAGVLLPTSQDVPLTNSPPAQTRIATAHTFGGE